MTENEDDHHHFVLFCFVLSLVYFISFYCFTLFYFIHFVLFYSKISRPFTIIITEMQFVTKRILDWVDTKSK